MREETTKKLRYTLLIIWTSSLFITIILFSFIYFLQFDFDPFIELSLFNGIAAIFIIIILLISFIKHILRLISRGPDFPNVFLLCTVIQWCLGFIAALILVNSSYKSPVINPIFAFFFIFFLYILIEAAIDIIILWYCL